MATRLHRPKGEQRLDANGVPFNGGVYTFFQAGTNTPLAVYRDEAAATPWGTSVTLDASGRLTDAVFVGETDFKETFTPPVASGEAAITFDGYPGAEPAPDTSQARPVTPVSIASGATVTMTAPMVGTVQDVDTTSSNTTFVLLPPDDLDNGQQITVRKTVAGNRLTISGPIDGDTTLDLTDAYDGVTLVSNGVDSYRVTAFSRPGVLPMPIKVADRLSAPPGSPSAGAFYILAASPTGAWSSYAQHDIVRADGLGGWDRFTPTADCGWLAYVQDENLFTAFIDTAWADQTGMATPNASTLKSMFLRHAPTSGTAVGSNTAGAWNTRPVTQVSNSIASASHDDSTFTTTLPAGTYLVLVGGTNYSSGRSRTRFKSTTTATSIDGLNSFDNTGSADGLNSVGFGVLTLSGEELFRVETYIESGTYSLGLAVSAASANEHYAECVIIDMASLQGPIGAQGPQGPAYGAAQTALELAASVTPTNTEYPPGDVRRYGADPTGVANSATAWIDACKSGHQVLGGGRFNYAITSSVSLTTAVDIDGQGCTLVPSGNTAVFLRQLSATATTTINATRAVVTISNGAGVSAGVVTWTAHGLANGTEVYFFSSTSDPPLGVAQLALYYVVNAAADTFEIALTSGGTAINTASAGTGTIIATATKGQKGLRQFVVASATGLAVGQWVAVEATDCAITTVTISIATPGEITWASHGRVAGERVSLSTTGALPTGLTASTVYYVLAAGMTANTFRVAASEGGAAINTSGTQSGTHTITAGWNDAESYHAHWAKITNIAGTTITIDRPLSTTYGGTITLNAYAAANILRELKARNIRFDGSASTYTGIGSAFRCYGFENVDLDVEVVNHTHTDAYPIVISTGLDAHISVKATGQNNRRLAALVDRMASVRFAKTTVDGSSFGFVATRCETFIATGNVLRGRRKQEVDAGGSANSTRGIKVYGCGTVIIGDNKISDYESPIRISSCERQIVRANAIENTRQMSGADAIAVNISSDFSGMRMVEASIVDNDINETYGTAIGVSGDLGGRPIIARNNIRRTQSFGIYSIVRDPIIIDNQVIDWGLRNSSDQAIYHGGLGGRIRGNRFSHFVYFGLTCIRNFWPTSQWWDVGDNSVKGNNPLGAVFSARGSSNIASGSTSQVITHGLSWTPALSDIRITLGELSTNDPGQIYVDTITSTQFTVRCRNNPGASNLDFQWEANVLMPRFS